MTHRKSTGLALAALALVAGCSSTADPPPTTTTPPPSVDQAAPPAQCATAVGDPSLNDSGPIGQAVGAVTVAANVTVMGTQVIDSARQPGTSEVIVRVCSWPLDEAALTEVGAPLATAAKGAGVPVSLVKVSLYVPDGDSVDQALSVDF